MFFLDAEGYALSIVEISTFFSPPPPTFSSTLQSSTGQFTLSRKDLSSMKGPSSVNGFPIYVLIETDKYDFNKTWSKFFVQ